MAVSRSRHSTGHFDCLRPPFCFVLNDNVKFWKALTLRDDREILEGHPWQKTPSINRAHESDIPMYEVLAHIESETNSAWVEDRKKFGVIGFARNKQRWRMKTQAFARYV